MAAGFDRALAHFIATCAYFTAIHDRAMDQVRLEIEAFLVQDKFHYPPIKPSTPIGTTVSVFCP